MRATFSAASRCSEARNASNYDGLTLARTALICQRKWRWVVSGLVSGTRASHSPDEIDEYAFVVVLQIGQVVGEVGEVVGDAGLQVLANMTIDRDRKSTRLNSSHTVISY